MRKRHAIRLGGRTPSHAGIFALCVLLCAFSGSAQSKELQLKVQMVRKMIPYVTWPKDAMKRAKNVITIGVVGQGPIGGALEKVCKNAQVKGRPIRVIRFPPWKDIEEGEKKKVLSCLALLVTRSEQRSLARIVTSAQKRPILLFSDTPGFALRGTHINFFIARSKVAFETNAKAARRVGIHMSSKLLRLGRRVD